MKHKNNNIKYKNFFGSFLNLIEVDFTPIISSSLIS